MVAAELNRRASVGSQMIPVVPEALTPAYVLTADGVVGIAYASDGTPLFSMPLESDPNAGIENMPQQYSDVVQQSLPIVTQAGANPVSYIHPSLERRY